jgi:hypothetical protein
MDRLLPVIRALTGREVRFVVIGVGEANYWARGGSTVFTTKDRDLFRSTPITFPGVERCVRQRTSGDASKGASRGAAGRGLQELSQTTC